MNPVLEHLPLEGEESFFAKAFDLPYFGTPWHYHSEYEIVMVVKSHGKRFIGNAVSDFKDGDLTFLGPNLPHLYRNPPAYYENNPEFRAKSIVVHFLEKSLGMGFLELPQARKIRKLFDRSHQGIDITGAAKMKVIPKLKKLIATRGMERLILLIEILNIFANTTDYRLISGPGIKGHNLLDSDRMNKIFQYILQNFQSEIKLEDVSNIICLTPTSFCRYFKERTKRTFSEFLIDFRLNHASKLMIETDKNILEICYESGYNNLSNFNRHFRQKYGMSPREYRQAYRL